MVMLFDILLPDARRHTAVVLLSNEITVKM